METKMNNLEKAPVEIAKKVIRKRSFQIANENLVITIDDSFNQSIQHKHNNYEQIGHDRKYEKHKIENEEQKENDKTSEKRLGEEIDPDAPKDKYNIVWIVCFISGIVQVLPYAFFVTANEYWMYKFRNATSNSTDADDRTYLQANYSSLSRLISLGPSLVVQLLLTILGHKIKAKIRILVSLVIYSLVFLLQTAFVNINTDDWQLLFFGLTALSLTLISCSCCIGSSGCVIEVSKFPDKYLKIYLVGEGGGSLFTAIMRLVSIIAVPTTIGAALLYFVTGTCIMTMSVIVFYLTTRLEFYRYYTKSTKDPTTKQIPRFTDFREILLCSWPVITSLTILYLIPHSAVETLVVSEHYGTDNIWGSKYFVTCTTYLLTAICGVIGRTAFNKFEMNPSQSIVLWAIVLYQLIFLPLLFFVNAKPRKHLQVLFPHDWQYALIEGIKYFISGYLANMATFKSVRVVPPEKFELFWLVFLFIIKFFEIGTSPIGLLFVSLL